MFHYGVVEIVRVVTSATVFSGSRMSLSSCTSCCISSVANLFSASPHTSIILLFTHTHTHTHRYGHKNDCYHHLSYWEKHFKS